MLLRRADVCSTSKVCGYDSCLSRNHASHLSWIESPELGRDSNAAISFPIAVMPRYRTRLFRWSPDASNAPISLRGLRDLHPDWQFTHERPLSCSLRTDLNRLRNGGNAEVTAILELALHGMLDAETGQFPFTVATGNVSPVSSVFDIPRVAADRASTTVPSLEPEPAARHRYSFAAVPG